VDTRDVLKEHGMSENEENLKKPRRKRRQFTPEFKAGAVKLVLAEGKSSTEVARGLGLTESALRIWVTPPNRANLTCRLTPGR
jgi:transposase